MKGRSLGSPEEKDVIEKEPGRDVRRLRSAQHNRRNPRQGDEEERRRRGASARIRAWNDDDDDDGVEEDAGEVYPRA